MSSNKNQATARRSTQCTSFQCPGCGEVIPSTDDGYPTTSCCPACEMHLWCTKRIERGMVFLDAIPHSKTEISDVARVGKSIQHSGNVGGVIVNLSALETINSSFVAGLLVLRRLIETAGGNLVLSEVDPHVHAILQRLKLHTLFVIKDRGQDVPSPA